MTIQCKSPFTVDQYTTYRGLLNISGKCFVEILGMGEWAPLPPHESSGTPPSLSSENAYGGGV